MVPLSRVALFIRKPVWLAALGLLILGAVYLLLRQADVPRGSHAVAELRAGPVMPSVRGSVEFMSVPGGTLVTLRVTGLPRYQPGTALSDPVGPHGFHIHEFGNCAVGDPDNPFLAAGGHWNPDRQPHGNHAGDFPVIFSNAPGGTAMMRFFTSRFQVGDVVGRSVVIHLHPDDYRTQPAGRSGLRIACGVIR